MSLSRRRQPRFRYPAALRIIDKSAGRAVDATCLDLSTGGMGVRASGAYAVGSDVVCELEVGGRQLSLPGVVAWSEGSEGSGAREAPVEALAAGAASGKQHDERRVTQGLYRLGPELRSSEPTSDEYLIEVGADDGETPMGICFQSLVAEQARALDELLRDGEPVTSPVQLFFPGLPEPVTARAETLERGIRLSATLPFLSRDADVRFRLGNGEEQTGRVHRVAVSEAASSHSPRLEIDIIPGDEPAALTAPSAAAAARSGKQPTAVAGRNPKLPAILALLLGVSLGAAGMWLTNRYTNAKLAESNANAAVLAAGLEATAPAVPTNTNAGTNTSAAIAAAPEAEPGATTTSASDPAAAVATLEIPPELEAAVYAPPQEPPATMPEGMRAAAAPAQGTAVLAANAQETQNASGEAPQVTTVDGSTRVFIPMNGTDSEIGRYDLVSPGIVVTLPHAHALIPLADYPIYRGLVRRVWLRPHRDGVQARLVWRPGPGHAKVVFNAQGLTVTVRPY